MFHVFYALFTLFVQMSVLPFVLIRRLSLWPCYMFYIYDLINFQFTDFLYTVFIQYIEVIYIYICMDLLYISAYACIGTAF